MSTKISKASQKKAQKTTLRQEIVAKIVEQREKLSPASAKTYSSLLITLLAKLNLPQTLNSFIKYKAKILKYHRDNSDSKHTNKTRLSALYVLTNIEPYKTLMIELNTAVDAQYKNQELNAKQKENRIEFSEVKDKVNELKERVKDKQTEQTYVDYLLLALMSGVFTPPRRNEYVTIKIDDYDEDEDNYLENNVITFNKYKTSNIYGTQKVKISKILQPILNEWLAMNETDYLFTSRGKPITSSALSQRMHRIFDGKIIGSDELRSIYLSNLYADIPKIKEMEALASQMGHNVETAINRYVKKD